MSKQISAKKFKNEVIPVLMEKIETLQHNIGNLHNTIASAVGLKKERTYNQYNPVSLFKISIHTESYRHQSYIKLFVWSEATKSWNILLVPMFEHFGLNPTHLTTIHKPVRKYVDKIIKFCIDFSQNFI